MPPPPPARSNTAPQRLRALCYLDPQAEQALGREIGLAGGPEAAWGWLHAGLVQARTGPLHVTGSALELARQGFSAGANATGLAWCDEARAILLRRQGDFAASAALQAQVDARPGIEREPLHRFVALNARALTQQVLGNNDLALRSYYAALDAASDSGLEGPRITALCNLGSHHQNLYNLEDARRLLEQALDQALIVGIAQALTVAAVNLITVYCAAGEPHMSRAMVAFLAEHPRQVLPDFEQRYAPHVALGYLAAGEPRAAEQLLQRGGPEDLGRGDLMCIRAWSQTQCRLALGDPAGARAIGERFLAGRGQAGAGDPPFEAMQLLTALTEACERLGDHRAALGWQRQAHARYVQLVGRSARARQIALEVDHQLASARRERDRAVRNQRHAESDRLRLAELNAALQDKVAEAEQLQRQLQEQAIHDPLTGLHNRRYLFEAGATALQRAQRRQDVLCVAIVDLDHFKRLNDTCGHAAGDRALQHFATLLRQHLRGSDIVCRYGGEEFVAVMYGAGCGQAQVVLDRLQQALQQPSQGPGPGRTLRCSFSAGIAQFPQHGQTLEQLLTRADKALYRAKHLGRRRAEQAATTTLGDLT